MTDKATDADRALANAVAEAISSVGVAYSHETNVDMETINKQWSVHETGGNPFEKDEWLFQSNDKEEALSELRDALKRTSSKRDRLALADVVLWHEDEIVEALEAAK